MLLPIKSSYASGISFGLIVLQAHKRHLLQSTFQQWRVTGPGFILPVCWKPLVTGRIQFFISFSVSAKHSLEKYCVLHRVCSDRTSSTTPPIKCTTNAIFRKQKKMLRTDITCSKEVPKTITDDLSNELDDKNVSIGFRKVFTSVVIWQQLTQWYVFNYLPENGEVFSEKQRWVVCGSFVTSVYAASGSIDSTWWDGTLTYSPSPHRYLNATHRADEKRLKGRTLNQRAHTVLWTNDDY